MTQIKSAATDGYDAVQVSFGRRRVSRVSGPLRGHYAKAEVVPGVKLGEFSRRGEGEIKPGQNVAAADVFKAGDRLTFRELPRDAVTRALSGAITSLAFPARAARTSIFATAVRSAIVLIPAACARG